MTNASVSAAGQSNESSGGSNGLSGNLLGKDVNLLNLRFGEEHAGVGSQRLAHTAGEMGISGLIVGEHVVHAKRRGSELDSEPGDSAGLFHHDRSRLGEE